MSQTLSPSAQIDAALDAAVGEAGAAGRPVGGMTVEADLPDGRSRVVVEDAERLGVLASSVEVERAGGAASSVTEQANEVARRLIYLSEPMAVIETDAKRGRGVVRSSSLRPSAEGPEYNEAILEGGGSIRIRRYRVEGRSRRRVASNLSRETLGRLVDDLDAILRS